MADDGISFVIHFLVFDTQPQKDILTINKSDSDLLLLELSSWLPSDLVVIIEEPVISMMFMTDITTASTGFLLEIERLDSYGKWRCLIGFKNLISWCKRCNIFNVVCPVTNVPGVSEKKVQIINILRMVTYSNVIISDMINTTFVYSCVKF